MTVKPFFLAPALAPLLALAGAITIALPPSTANAAASVFGAGPARACYEAAAAGQTGQSALAACDDALAQADALSTRDRAATYINRGVVRLLRREGAPALADFDRALALQPRLGEAHVNRGAALVLLRRNAEAVTAISTGLDLGSDDPHEGYFNRALAYEAMGDLANAYRDYRQAATLKPDWDLPQQELARFTVRQPG